MINIAIDGPAGAGKSTIAKAVAKQLGIIYLDTGAMYRATAYFALQQGIDVKDEVAVEKMFEAFEMKITYENGAQQIYVNGLNTTPYLREHYMSKAASDISALKCVRFKMVDLQREFAKTNDVVLDGRDIGTFVLPDANCKIFMIASPEERANRRYKELLEKGQTADYDTILKDINERDYNDSHRAIAPLKKADDALELDTTTLTIDEVIEKVISIVKEKTQPKVENAQPKAVEVKSTNNEVKINDGKDDENKEVKPLKKYKKRPWVFRIFRAVMKPLALFLWPTKVINKENYKKFGGGLIMCNHYSKLDGVIMCSKMIKDLNVVIKVDAFEGADIANWFLSTMGGIPVRRGEADIAAVKAIMEVLKQDDKQLLIFPEGTRNKAGDQNMAPFKEGTARFAIKAKRPILPMIYFRSQKPFRKNWLYVGEPFDLSEFYNDRPSAENKKKATAYVRQKMDETRVLCNEYVYAHNKKLRKEAEENK